MQYLQPFFDLLGQIVEKFGTKFAIALTGLLFLGYPEYVAVTEAGANPIPIELRFARIGGIVIIAIGYFFARRKQESEQLAAKITAPTEVKQ